ncbi:hypothetical protein T01_3324 [Trichinella spiralis]|uniref:Uncharacterized protein n=1 Tax=Trichinella spiralis TaxID=6334 RepID=A0A0V1AQU8_TRISP|nr:hypothetical protein T01_3324 [Trichinella spiralis]
MIRKIADGSCCKQLTLFKTGKRRYHYCSALVVHFRVLRFKHTTSGQLDIWFNCIIAFLWVSFRMCFNHIHCKGRRTRYPETHTGKAIHSHRSPVRSCATGNDKHRSLPPFPWLAVVARPIAVKLSAYQVLSWILFLGFDADGVQLPKFLQCPFDFVFNLNTIDLGYCIWRGIHRAKHDPSQRRFDCYRIVMATSQNLLAEKSTAEIETDQNMDWEIHIPFFW